MGAVREQQLRSRSFKNPAVVLNLFSSTSSSTKIPAGVGSSTDEPRRSYPLSIRYGLVVRIPGSHPGGPGSIPGNGIIFSCRKRGKRIRRGWDSNPRGQSPLD